MKRILSLFITLIITTLALTGCVDELAQWSKQIMDSRRELTEEEVFENVEIYIAGAYPNIVSEARYSFTNRFTEKIKLDIEKLDWEKGNARVSAYMEDSDAQSLKVKLNPMTKELTLPKYPSYYVDWMALPLEEKKTLKQAGEKIIHKALETAISKSANDVFEYTSDAEGFSSRKFVDINLHNICYMQIRQGSTPDKYDTSLFSNSKSLYSRLILTYSFTVYDHVHKKGMVRYLPVFANNSLLLENGEISYDLSEVEIDDHYVCDAPLDLKARYMDEHDAKYEIFHFSSEEFFKEKQ